MALLARTCVLTRRSSPSTARPPPKPDALLRSTRELTSVRLPDAEMPPASDVDVLLNTVTLIKVTATQPAGRAWSGRRRRARDAWGDHAAVAIGGAADT